MKKIAMTLLTALAVTGCTGDKMPVVHLPEIDLSNPLLAEWKTPCETPPFDSIRLENYKPAFETAIAVARAEIDAIIVNDAKPTFRNTIVPLERSGIMLGRVSGIFFNLLEANATPEMQRLATEIQPMVTEFGNDLSLDPELFARVKAVYEKPGRGLSAVDKRLLENTYRGFVRGGANLSEEDKELYRTYSSELSDLQLKFSENVLNATNAFTLHLTDPKQVAELPAGTKEAMAADAKARGMSGWIVTLQAPSYMPFMTYSSDRPLKEQLWTASNSRAMSGEFDNREIIKQIVNTRLKQANLLGYATYADYVLEERMAENTKNVNDFLEELLSATKAYADKDVRTIEEYAHTKGLQGALMPWDFPYYSEKYREEKFALNQELLKPYFQLEKVQEGIFLLAGKLYGLEFRPNAEIPVYHPDVKAYEVLDKSGVLKAVIYLDFFPRETKRGGAWMTEFRGSYIIDEKETRPLVSLVMNFTKPTETTPSLLTFDEVDTFLHEFGHALHGILAEGTYGSMNGPSVYRDFVELPSQIMENWGVEKEFLDLWATHYQTGEKIPAELIDKIIAAQNYQAAYLNVRQLSFAITDMLWHSITVPFEGDPEAFEREAMASTQILPAVEGTALSPSFGHIFAGGYAAGYYGYKWAEVLEADAFSLFKEQGIFNTEVAESFRENILSKGNQDHPMTLYTNFRGHKPETKALIDKMELE